MFYICENWQAGPHKTVIHEGSCASCNEGTGRVGGYDRRHASWHGPYRTLEDAREAASAVAQAVVRNEHRCVKVNGKGPGRVKEGGTGSERSVHWMQTRWERFVAGSSRCSTGRKGRRAAIQHL